MKLDFCSAASYFPRVKPKVFVSYSRTDATFAGELCLKLKNAKLSTWLDIDGLKPGAKWQPKVEAALRNASAVVVCLSPKAASSKFVTFEWSYALGVGVKVFPVLVKKKTELHPRLSQIQWIDLSGKNPPWDELIEALERVPRSRRIGRRTRKKVRRTKAQVRRSSPKRPGGPELIATFETKKGKPVMIGDEYSIVLGVTGVPPGANRVSYELHDDSFDEPRFHVDNHEEGFEASISSYGDVRISAKGKKGKSAWATDEMLGEALRRGHGTQASAVIRKAIAMIEKY